MIFLRKKKKNPIKYEIKRNLLKIIQNDLSLNKEGKHMYCVISIN
jgi:hypothetical protein